MFLNVTKKYKLFISGTRKFTFLNFAIYYKFIYAIATCPGPSLQGVGSVCFRYAFQTDISMAINQPLLACPALPKKAWY